jgi:hypothetical protein
MEPGENIILRKLIRETLEDKLSSNAYIKNEASIAHNSLMDIRLILDTYSVSLQKLFADKYGI